MSTRAAAGSESCPKSEIELCPGPRRASPERGSCGEPPPQRPEPSDGSPSKCVEKGYGKPLKGSRRSFLNFCKQRVRVKALPSNCPPNPAPKPEETFWDYLFKFDKRTTPEPSTCRIALRHREACRKTDPRLCDPRYRQTQGDVLLFTEPLRPPCCTSSEPQPRSPPPYPPPKAVACRRLVEAVSKPSMFASVAEALRAAEEKVKTRCSGPQRFRIPFEECRPPRKSRKAFSCRSGVRGSDVAPPVSINRGTCAGRSVGEILAEATISRSKDYPQQKITVNTRCEPQVTVKNSSRLQRLQKLIEAADCTKNLSKARDK